MSKMMNEVVNENEMAEIMGGKNKKHDDNSLGKRTNKYCLQCEITGRNMTQHLYRKNGKVYCPVCGTVYPEWS